MAIESPSPTPIDSIEDPTPVPTEPPVIENPPVEVQPTEEPTIEAPPSDEGDGEGENPGDEQPVEDPIGEGPNDDGLPSDDELPPVCELRFDGVQNRVVCKEPECEFDYHCQKKHPRENFCIDSDHTGSHRWFCVAGTCEERGPFIAECRGKRVCTNDTGLCSRHRGGGDTTVPTFPELWQCGDGFCDPGEDAFRCKIDCGVRPQDECGRDYCHASYGLCENDISYNFHPVCRTEGCYFKRKSTRCTRKRECRVFDNGESSRCVRKKKSRQRPQV
ncbi:MAG: hypothetical protein KDD60_02590 [Bdellovibrionales bacterium]|nr:hypothetical protein [Bdellovibrionales bacterium]